MNAALEDYSRLVKLDFNLQAKQVDVNFSISPDSETERVYEQEDLTWKLARNKSCTFRLGSLSRIAISTGKEELPPEIAATITPSRSFMMFAASLFDDSGIFEWECFPKETDPSLRPFGGARWVHVVTELPPEQQSYMELFKHRSNALWTIGLWFGTLQIDPIEPVSIDDFLSLYPQRIAWKHA